MLIWAHFHMNKAAFNHIHAHHILDTIGVEHIRESGEDEWSIDKVVAAPLHIWNASEDDEGILGMPGPEPDRNEDKQVSDAGDNANQKHQNITETIWVRLPRHRWPKKSGTI